MQMRYRSAWAAVLLALVAPLAAQQTAPQPARPRTRSTYGPDPLSFKSGCPYGVAPATNNTVASAVDFVELERAGCTRDSTIGCAAYKVRVSGDGSVTWFGGENVQVQGAASAIIDTTQARGLLQRFADANFYTQCTQYGVEAKARVVTTLSVAGQRRTIQDYANAAPSFLRDLATDLDRTADTHRWRHGDPAHETFAADHLLVDVRQPKDGVTKLMKAAVLEPGTLAVMVTDRALDLNEADASGWTAMMYAAQAGQVEALWLLYQNGADPFRRSKAGETAMSAAVSARDGAPATVMALRRMGLDVNERDHRGVSPLMLACRYGTRRATLIKTLLELNADITQRDADGKRAIDYLAGDDPLTPGDVGLDALLTSPAKDGN